jgi:YHS domain-containing protein
MNTTATTSGNVVDPVCGMHVDPAKANITSTYNDQKYHFCAEGCRLAFEKCPRKYLDPKPVKKGVWGRYMDRLKKATGGKAVKCH